MRFVPPVAGLSSGAVAFDGDPHMRSRPVGEVLTALRALGVEVDDEGRSGLPFTVRGTGAVRGGTVVIDGNLTVAQLEAIAADPALRQADLRVVPASPGKAERLAPLLGLDHVTLYLNRAEAETLAGHPCTDAAEAASGLAKGRGDAPLYPHQVQGVAWNGQMLRSELHAAVLSDETGLGKTIQSMETDEAVTGKIKEDLEEAGGKPSHRSHFRVPATNDAISRPGNCCMFSRPRNCSLIFPAEKSVCFPI